MANFKAIEMIKLLDSLSDVDKGKKARNFNSIKAQIDNVMLDTKIMLNNQSAEDVIKYILWQGILNQYGIFGQKRNDERTFKGGKENYYSKSYIHGDLLSIDFGTSNLGNEFAFTHTAIVIADYTDYVLVIPVTSCKEGRLEDTPEDEIRDILTITKKDFEDIESDSYVLLYQIRSVSKNRITKYIGTISGTNILDNIDKKIIEIFAPKAVDEISEI